MTHVVRSRRYIAGRVETYGGCLELARMAMAIGRPDAVTVTRSPCDRVCMHCVACRDTMSDVAAIFDHCDDVWAVSNGKTCVGVLYFQTRAEGDGDHFHAMFFDGKLLDKGRIIKAVIDVRGAGRTYLVYPPYRRVFGWFVKRHAGFRDSDAPVPSGYEIVETTRG